MKRKIGGDRLGSGNQMHVDLKTYNRSTFNLDSTFKSSMAPGTLVPFMKKLALPGDTWDIGLNCRIDTHPSVGPLFDSYKVQLDVFTVPFRLYQSQIAVNKLGIGREMGKVKLPQIELEARSLDYTTIPATQELVTPLEEQQINRSALFNYLGISGLGREKGTPSGSMRRKFNAVP